MNSSYYIPALVVIAAILLIYFVTKSKKDTPVIVPPVPVGPPPSSKEVASTNAFTAFGDSITVPLDFSTLTPAWLNRAIAGTTGVAWLMNAVAGPSFTIAQMNQELAATARGAALWRYGINDSNFNVGVIAFRQAVENFVDQCRANGIVPILSGLTRFSGTQAQELSRLTYNAIIYSVAQEKSVHFIDVNAVAYYTGDTPDNLHPGLAYRQRIQDFIIAMVRDLKILP